MRPRLLACIAIAALLAGCSGSDSGDDGEPTASPSPTPTAQPNSPPPPGTGTDGENATEYVRQQFFSETVTANSAQPASFQANVPAEAREVTFVLLAETQVFTKLTVELEGCGVATFGGSGLTAGTGGETESPPVCDEPSEGAQELLVSLEAGTFEGALEAYALVPKPATT